MGRPDVDAMLDSISSREWSEWMVFWRRYGFGERRMDGRFAGLMAQIANILRGEGDALVTTEDILPDEDEPDDEGDMLDEYDTSDVLDEDQIIFEALAREALGDGME